MVNATPIQWFIKKRIDERERLVKARALANGEKGVMAQSDAFYRGKSTDNTLNYDKKEINFYMESV